MIGEICTFDSGGRNDGDDYWYQPYGWSSASTSGVHVTEDSMLASPAVLQAVRLNAEMVATLPLYLMENVEVDGLPTVRYALNHPLYDRFLYQPNPLLTSFQFFRMLAASTTIHGNFFAQIIRTPGGDAEFWPLHSTRVELKHDKADARVIYYEYRKDDGGKVRIEQRDMLHISGFSPHGLIGRGILKDGKNAIGRMQAAEMYGSAVFKNGSTPGGALRHPGRLKDTTRENLRTSWHAIHQGADNAHTVAILEEGVEWVNTGIAPKDAQMIECMTFQVLEVARLTGIPPHLLMDLSRINISNVGELARQWLVFGLNATLTNIRQSLHTKMFPREDWRRYELRHDTEQIQRPDMKTFYELTHLAVGRPFLSVNEARAKHGLSSIPGEDTLYIPLNMGNAGGDPEEQNEPMAPPQEIPDVE